MKRLSILLSVLVLAGCASTSGGSGGASLNLVAAENFWGSIATQIAGSKATVHSIIVNPATDPHAYEPTAQDGRTLATAQLAIVNGIGYDPWAPKLLAANPVSGRIVLNVGDLLGFKEGDNPHRWYDPANVETVARTIAADLGRLDPKDASYFNQRLQAFETAGLAQYHALIAQIKSRYSGVPVGASESIFALQAPALGVKLLTPYSFMKATSEGTDPSAQDIVTIQHQLATRQIKVWIYNSQNATPQIQRFNQLARASGIPIATITETLDPPSYDFQQWQVSQLKRIAAALHRATGHGPLSALSLRRVSLQLGGRPILTDVELQVAEGEFIAVLGPNGAGKSTLMRAILGLVPLAGGSVEVLGRPPAAARSQVGYLPQRHGFDRGTRIRGIDLVRLGLDGTRWGIPVPLTPGARARHRAERARVEEVISLVGAQSYARRPIGQLSGGEQQRLLIAQALISRPRILILDEPLDGLDIPNQTSVAALLRRIASAENVALLLVAHDVNPLVDYLDRVIYLAGGRAVAGPVQEVITAEQLSALYGTRIDVLQAGDGRLVVVGAPDAPHQHGPRHGD